MVVTTDFFMPIVDDPRHFGRIAAANAISDVYAMGGKPCLALSVLGMPINKLPTEVIQVCWGAGAKREPGCPWCQEREQPGCFAVCHSSKPAAGLMDGGQTAGEERGWPGR